MQLQWWLAGFALLGAACGDDAAAAGDTDAQTSSTGGDASETTTPEPATSSTTATSSGSATETGLGGTDGESTTEVADSSSTGGGLTELEADVTLHPEQPMVVDVTVYGDAPLPEDLALTHDFDGGVRVAIIDESDPDSRTYRLRGLAPATAHSATATAGDVSAEVTFSTEAPLPGFIPSFDVSGASSGEEPYRMFDLSPFPLSTMSSVFVVDPSGTTRWHLGFDSKDPLPGRLDSVTTTANGTVQFAMQNRFLELDELGTILTDISATQLGIFGIHHEAMTLPSGNVLVLSYSFREVDYPGAPNTLVAGDTIVEFTLEGDVVWTWDTFDHLDPQRVLEPIDSWTIAHPVTGELAYDWTHANGVALAEDGDQLLLSLRHQDWLVAIDRETSDIDWVLGAEGDFSLTEGTWFRHQHSPQWQPDGSLLIYDNAVEAPSGGTTDALARAVRYEVDTIDFTATQVWEIDQQDVSVPFAGDSNLLPANGNYLVLDSTIVAADGFRPRLREVDPTASPMVQWTLDMPAPYFSYRTSASDALVGEPR